MHDEIEFSRQICERDPAYAVIRFRLPRVVSSDAPVIEGDFTGEAARRKLVKCMFAMTNGILEACGADALADALKLVYSELEEEGQIDEDDSRNIGRQRPVGDGMGRPGTH